MRDEEERWRRRPIFRPRCLAGAIFHSAGMRPDREAGLYGSLFRAGGEFSGFNFASFPTALISFHVAWGLAFQNYPQHKLLCLLRRSASHLFLLDFVSHAARMIDEDEQQHHGVGGFFPRWRRPIFRSPMSRYLEG